MARLRNWMAEARRLEAEGDLPAAIAIFRKALVAQEETTGFADLSVQNGLGDLYLRVGRVDEAIEAYEDAAQQCEDQQLYANGIALCKKILRNAPDNEYAYRRAARLSALSGLEAEANRHFTKYRELVIADGRAGEALDSLREIVEITGDEELTFELAEGLIDAGRQQDALDALRAVRDRRESEGRGVVLLLRLIQDLQLELEPERPPLEAATSGESTSPRRSADGGTSASRPQQEHVDESPEAVPSPRPDSRRPSGAPDPHPGGENEGELQALAASLRVALAELEGAERLETALAIIDEMLDIEPGRFDLLSRKLHFAYALGDEPAIIRAFLALGECLDRNLGSFTVRLLSTSTETGSVTAAIGVENLADVVRGS